MPASPSQTPRRLRVLSAVVRVLQEVKAAADNLAVDVAEDADVEAVEDSSVK